MKKTHYERLNVSEDTGAGELYDAWQSEIQRLKAETEPGIGQAVAMAEINESFRLLADRDRRAAYDRKLAAARGEASSEVAPAEAAPMAAPVESRMEAPVVAPMEAPVMAPAADPVDVQVDLQVDVPADLPASTSATVSLDALPTVDIDVPTADPLPVIDAQAVPASSVDVDLPVDATAWPAETTSEAQAGADQTGVRLSDFGDLDSPEGRAATPALADIDLPVTQQADNAELLASLAAIPTIEAEAPAPAPIDPQEASTREAIRGALEEVAPPTERDSATLERRPDQPEVVAPLPSWAANEAPASRARGWIAMAATFVVGAGLGLFGGPFLGLGGVGAAGGGAAATQVAQSTKALQPKPIQDIAPATAAALPPTAASGVVTGLDGEPASAPMPDTTAVAAAQPGEALVRNSATVVTGSIADSAPALAAAPSADGASAIDLGNGIIVPPPPRVAREDTGAFRALWLAVAWANEGHLLDGDTLALPSGWQRGLAKAPAAR